MALSGTKLDDKKLFKKILTYIKNHKNAVQISDITGLLCSKQTFYKYFPTGSDRYEQIVDAMDENRIALKAEIRDRLLNLNQAAALIALYKLIGTEEERTALSNVKVDTKKESDSGSTITLTFG